MLKVQKKENLFFKVIQINKKKHIVRTMCFFLQINNKKHAKTSLMEKKEAFLDSNKRVIS